MSVSENPGSPETDATITVKPSTTERIGTMVGWYKLLEQIGEGGVRQRLGRRAARAGQTPRGRRKSGWIFLAFGRTECI